MADSLVAFAWLDLQAHLLQIVLIHDDSRFDTGGELHSCHWWEDGLVQGNRNVLADIEGTVPDDCWVLRCGGPHYGAHRSDDPHCAHRRSKYHDLNSRRGSLC